MIFKCSKKDDYPCFPNNDLLTNLVLLSLFLKSCLMIKPYVRLQHLPGAVL